MSLVSNCLEKLFKNGQITRVAADSALMIYQGAQGKLGRDIPPTSADGAAALEAARIMSDNARLKKLSIAKSAIAMRAAEDRALNHPKGPIAGFMSMMVRDIHGVNNINVEAHTDVVFGALQREAGEFIERFRSRAAGLLPQNHISIRNAVLEMRGKDTGDAAAKEAAGAMAGAIEVAFKRARKAGVPISRLEDWQTPQFWEGARLRQFGRDEFTKDVAEHVDAGRMEIIDKDAFDIADRGTSEAIVNRAFDDITVGKASSGITAGIKNYTRMFRFKDADTYAKMMDKYGPGDRGYYGMMVGYLQSMSREIAMAEILGPNHRALAGHMVLQAKKIEAAKPGHDVKLPFSQKTVTVPKVRNPFESAGSVDRTYKYLSGQANSVENEMMAGVSGGLRAIASAAKLGSAAVTAVPGDLATSALASAHMGMSPLRIVRGIAREATSSTKSKQIAQRLNIISHSVMDHSLNMKRFEDELAGEGVPQRLASLVIRGSGLAAWTDMLKRVFTMETMGFIADQSSRGWKKIDPKFREFLQSHQFTAGDWDVLRRSAKFDVGGAKFFDLEAIEDRLLADRLLGAVIDERHFAVVEPDARIRQVTTAGQKRGSFGGEIARSTAWAKTFAMSIVMTHFKRAASEGPIGLRVWRMGLLLTSMTIAGGVALQLRAPLRGEDFRDPLDPKFAMQSFFYGGGAGIYGDLIQSGVARGKIGAAELLGGPVLEAAADVLSAPFGAFRNFEKWYAGESTNFGTETAGFMQRYTPGSTLWYARLLIDRYIFDTIQAVLDTDYFASFKREADRLQKRTGQGFFWAPGDTSPARLPQISPSAP